MSEVHIYTIECILDHVGADPGDTTESDSEITTSITIGGKTKSSGPFTLPVNQNLNPPLQLLLYKDAILDAGNLSVSMFEVDSTTPNDTIIGWTWLAPRLPVVGIASQPFVYPFGQGRENPTQEMVMKEGLL
ncbi:predicted protein [Naegleria gruberi]|uniref:Predicted protein n=1 Tax=Naegleria gruberi TaxID=5762 RepID=D2W3J9_NAEGR|nr:uncharacterized protein NAEGRDRAFT_75967 [Naegleria gruberi]EFC36323.1 predicted protein [Naegleria gruberi]|eukprot:XP_002669067.1 predicted protein [Naegleria gruberi strain NEG-M]